MITSVDFTAALAAAKPGDTLELEGDFGDFKLRRRQELTFKGGRFRSFHLESCNGIRVEGMEIAPGPAPTAGAQAVRVWGCEEVTFDRVRWRGSPAENGVEPTATVLDATRNVLGLPSGAALFAERCKRLAITRSLVRGMATGFQANAVDGFTVTDSDFADLRTTPINGGILNDVLIARNRGGGTRWWRYPIGGGKYGGDHADFIHFWTKSTQAGPSRNIRILDNLWEQLGGGAIIGIQIDDDRNAKGYVDSEVTGNVLITDEAQAIRVERFAGLIERNIALPVTLGRWPGIIYDEACAVAIRENRAHTLTLRPKQAGEASPQPLLENARNDWRPAVAGEAEAAVAAWVAKFRPAATEPASTPAPSPAIEPKPVPEPTPMPDPTTIPAPEPVPVPAPTPTFDPAEQRRRLLKSREEINALKNGAGRALYAIDKALAGLPA